MDWSLERLSVLTHASTWALFGVSTSFVAFRFYSKLRRVGPGFQTDDWVLLAGWIFVLAASAMISWLMVVFVIPGMIEKITIARVHHNLQSISLGLTKTSFGLTLLRVMPKGWETKVIWILLITMNLQFAIHIIASWQAICGAPDQGHIAPGNCWNLTQSTAFTVFSAGKSGLTLANSASLANGLLLLLVYSAFCDFALAILPWRMIFRLNMKLSERIGLAVALSIGVLAGVTGIFKAIHGYHLADVRASNFFYNQAVYWIWSQAEPNVTMISASIPAIRGFVKHARTASQNAERTSSGIHWYRAANRGNTSTVTSGYGRRATNAISLASQKSKDSRETSQDMGIKWTREFNVQFDTSSSPDLISGDTSRDSDWKTDKTKSLSQEHEEIDTASLNRGMSSSGTGG